MNDNKCGVVLVISGPSGGGKGTVVEKLRELLPQMKLSVSSTTRAPRGGEIPGVHYNYITPGEFEKMIDEGSMLEYTKYCTDKYYGTPKGPVMETIEAGGDMLLEIEVDGAMQVKAKFPEAVTVMLIPPTLTELESRLRGRNTETGEEIQRRLERAAEEIKFAHKYDYVVVNHTNKTEECAALIKSIVDAKKHQSGNMKTEIENFTA